MASSPNNSSAPPADQAEDVRARQLAQLREQVARLGARTDQATAAAADAQKTAGLYARLVGSHEAEIERLKAQRTPPDESRR